MSRPPGGAEPPPSWSRRRLRDVAVQIQDGTHFSPKPGGTDYKYITSRNIGPGYLKLDSVETIAEAEHRKIFQRCKVRFGDLLLTKDGANTGNAAISSFREEVSLLSSVAVIRADRRQALEAYLLHYLLSHSGRKQIADAMSGNAITRLTLATIKELVVPLPPVEEQRAIAAVLATLDGQADALRALIVKRQNVKQAMMQQLLTGTKRLPGFEEPWAARSMRSLGVVYGGLTGKTRADFGVGAALYVPFMAVLASACVTRESLLRVRIGRAERQNAVRTGDLLFNTSSETPEELAMCAVAQDLPPDTYLNSFCFGFRLSSPNVANPRFLAYFFRSEIGRRLMVELAQGATRYNLSRSKFRETVIELPAIDEQRAIAAVLEDADAEITALGDRLAKAHMIKQGMMQELLTGRTRLPVAQEETAA